MSDLKWVQLEVNYNLENPYWEITHSDILDLNCSGAEEKESCFIYNFESALMDDLEWKTSLELVLTDSRENNALINYVWSERKIENWVEKFKENYQRFDIFDDFTILPPWDQNPVLSRNSLMIEPKMAFGTGTHETTQLAASLIKYTLSRNHFEFSVASNFNNPSSTFKQQLEVIDVGCGTGILGLIASKLLDEQFVNYHITLTDIDPLALENTQENVELNCPNKLSLFSISKYVTPEPKYPIVIANIISSVLLALDEELVAYMAEKNSYLILSGILKEEKDRLKMHFQTRFNLILESEVQKGDWIGLLFKKS